MDPYEKLVDRWRCEHPGWRDAHLGNDPAAYGHFMKWARGEADPLNEVFEPRRPGEGLFSYRLRTGKQY
jgi:hypothetical protein